MPQAKSAGNAGNGSAEGSSSIAVLHHLAAEAGRDWRFTPHPEEELVADQANVALRDLRSYTAYFTRSVPLSIASAMMLLRLKARAE